MTTVADELSAVAIAAGTVYGEANEYAVDLVLVLLDGTTRAASGLTAHLPSSPADMRAAWSKGGLHVWTARHDDQQTVEFIDLPATVPGGGGRFRVYHREADHATSHYWLQDDRQGVI